MGRVSRTQAVVARRRGPPIALSSLLSKSTWVNKAHRVAFYILEQTCGRWSNFEGVPAEDWRPLPTQTLSELQEVMMTVGLLQYAS